MKFKTNISDLLQALDVASLITPAPVDSEGSNGYLLVVQGEECHLYSDDDHQKCRVSFPIWDVEGEGAFVLPTKGVAAYQNLEGWVEFESYEENGSHLINEVSEGGSTDKIVTFDPRSITPIDKDLKSAEDGPSFPVALLREALSLGKPYMAPENASNTKPQFKTMQIFDDSKKEWAEGNGSFFSSTGSGAFYLYCQAFEGKGLTIPGNRVGLLSSFLAKSEGEVTLRKSKHTTYLVNSKKQVIGWTDLVTSHGKYGLFPISKDKYVLHLVRDLMVKKLNYIKGKMGKDPKIRIFYDSKTSKITLKGSTDVNSPEATVPVYPKTAEELGENKGGELSDNGEFAFNVNAEKLLKMFTGLKTPNAEFRLSPADNKGYFLRTVEEFNLNDKGKVVVGSESEGEEMVYPCRATRFMLSMR